MTATSVTQVSSSISISEATNLSVVDDDCSVLPDFCSGHMILKIVVLAELLTMVIIVLTQTRYTGSVFADFITVSLFIQWMALTSSATLCVLRRWLNTLPPMRAVLLAYLVLLAIVVILSEMAVWVLYAGGYVETPRPVWYGEFHIQNLLVGIFINALVLHYLLAIHQLRLRTANAVALSSQVRRYRIRPRFLFNTLNNIAGLMRRRPTVAEAATEELADLVRLMLDEKQELTTLSREITNAQKFISLEALRLEDRLVVNWDYENFVNHIRTPVQVLQLLIEYVINVGIEPYTDGGIIGVNISKSEKDVQIEVTCDMEDTSTAGSASDSSSQSRNQAIPDSPDYLENTSKESVTSDLSIALIARIVTDKLEALTNTVSMRPTTGDIGTNTNTADSRTTKSSQSSQSNWYDTSMLDNIKVRLRDIYGVAGTLTMNNQPNRLLIRVKHPAEGGQH